jgi:hypothetical protein
MRILQFLASLALFACSTDDAPPSAADAAVDAVDAAMGDAATTRPDASAEAGSDSGGPAGCRPSGVPCADDLTSCCSRSCSVGVDFSACD